MQEKKWTIHFIKLFIIMIVSTIVFNILINPFGLFNIEHNLNKIKNHLINKKKTKFYYAKRKNLNILMMGTSRIEKLDPITIRPYVKGNIYNVALAGSSIIEQYNYLTYYINNNEINTIIMGIDFFSYGYKYNKNLNFDYITNSIYYKDYLESLLSSKALISSFKTLRDNIIKNKQPLYNFETGYDIPDSKDLSSNPKIFKKILLKYANNNYNNKKNYAYNMIDKNINYLYNIINLCKKNNIKLLIYVSPISYEQFNLIFIKNLGNEYLYWEKALSKVTNFYDFSGKNIITTNKNNYIDSSHFKNHIGKLIFAKLFDDKEVNIPADFGIFVTKDNINIHLKNLESSIKYSTIQELLNSINSNN